MTFHQFITSIRNNFERESYKRFVQQQWKKVNISSVIEENPDKSMSEHLETLIETLQDLQLGLDSKYRDDDYLQDKLIQACEENPAFQNAYYRPALSLEEFNNDLRSSVLAHEGSLNPNSTSLFTQRRFYKNNQRSISRFNKDGRINFNNRINRSENPKKCYIYKQARCLSNKHSDQEHETFKRNMIRKFRNRINQYIINDNDEYDFVTDSNNEPDELINGIELITTLCNNTTYHSITKDNLQPCNDPFSNAINNSSNNANVQGGGYNKNQFFGILIDTGALLRSTTGYGQYLAYKQLHSTNSDKIKLDRSKIGMVNVQLGIGSTSSLGSITIDTPLGMIEFHVVNDEIPFLLCLYDMDRLQVKLDNLNNVLLQGDKSFPVIRRFGHIFLPNKVIFKSSDFFLSTIELRRLHRRFCHPSADRLCNLLKNSKHEVYRNSVTNPIMLVKNMVDHPDVLNSHCMTNQLILTILFNHSIHVDVFYINGKPILHVVDETTRFQAAKWLANMTSQTMWDALRLCWIDVYVAPPDLITHDAGSNFTGQ
ncbi:hypothetical protein EPUL_006188 [Erysiphe pulchra]|uniref:Integrase catalytic domain-containing protein n=1 Tax=Erysiphe pulchra TaxID=225359 RepID=A0A2S4PK72_9PEZI|nr:hypothetical protein EPUL_006188 [Erysiphe pulchra]